jgi:hypothetical protein
MADTSVAQESKLSLDEMSLADVIPQERILQEAQFAITASDRSMAQLVEVLDTDNSGVVDEAEVREAIELFKRLRMQRESDSMEFGHLPEKIQEVLREWDHDGSGKINANELAAAADAWKKMKQEGRVMKKIILAMVAIILVILVGVFVLSYLAADMTKEARASQDGVMVTRSGAVMQVGSSDYKVLPDGSLNLRSTVPLNSSSNSTEVFLSNSLKVASAETKRRLSSTLPDSAFEQLKSITLKSQDRSLKLQITGFRRVWVRSSKCGSVVHLTSSNGQLTLDDYVFSADQLMEAYVASAGMVNLFNGNVSGFGRRLSESDGLLEGFFNFVEGVGWVCESVPLEPPEFLSRYYQTTAVVRQRHPRPEEGLSRLFTDPEGFALELAGIQLGENNTVYKSWTEETISAAGLEAYLGRFAMSPFTQQLRIKKSGFELTMALEDGMAYGCTIKPSGKSVADFDKSVASDGALAFVKLEEENGLVLRHFRMELLKTLEQQVNNRRLQQSNASNFTAMVMAGLVPNIFEYWDVDTDPTGGFLPGMPYRMKAYNNLHGSTYFLEKSYQSVRMLPFTLTVAGVFNLLGVTELDTPCLPQEAPGMPRLQDIPLEVMDAVHVLPIMNKSVADPDVFVPKVSAWTESERDIVKNYDRLVALAHASNINSPVLQWAGSFEYWSSILKFPSCQREIAAIRDEFSSTLLHNFSSASTIARRLGTVRPGKSPDEFHVAFTADDIFSRAGPGRRIHSRSELSQRGSSQTNGFGETCAEPVRTSRRLQSKPGKPVLTSSVSLDTFSFNLDFGSACQVNFNMEYCNNITGCDKLRFLQPKFVTGVAAGSALIWPSPEITANLGGNITLLNKRLIGELSVGARVSVYVGELSLTLKVGGKMWDGYLESLYGNVDFYVGVVVGSARAGATLNAKPYQPQRNRYRQWNICLNVDWEVTVLWWRLAGDDYDVFCRDINV